MKNLTLMALIAVMGLALTGCTPQAREEYSEAGQSAKMSVKKTGEAVATDAKVTGEVVKDKAAEAGRVAENATMTGRVRTAINDAKDLTIHDLDVDTSGVDPGERTIVLKGRADNEAAKQRAGDLAKNTATSEWKVDNQIVVGH
jgi:hypothetical protein